jgi:hypothetical protein
MNDPKAQKLKLNSQEEVVLANQEQQSSQTRRQFASPEEMLRYDQEQNPAPASIEARVQESMKDELATSKPWWKRLFGKTD